MNSQYLNTITNNNIILIIGVEIFLLFILIVMRKSIYDLINILKNKKFSEFDDSEKVKEYLLILMAAVSSLLMLYALIKEVFNYIN